MKRLHTIVAVLGIGLAGVSAWWWQHQPAPAAPGAPGAGAPGQAGAPAGGRGPGGGGPAPVEVGRATAQTLTDAYAAVGSLQAAQGVVLRPEVSGRIAKLGFNDGQRVAKGQLLLQLDDTLQQAQLKQAEASAGIARTNLQRSRELQGQGFVSASAVDQNAAALDVAEAQVALARAQLARMKVFAPFDATAGIRKVDVGDYVKDGADIVNLEDLRSLEVDFALPERYVTRVRPGQSVDVTLDAVAGQRFKGRVVALDSVVDANGRALQVRARVDNPGGLLRPGMFARARVVFASREGAVVVPEEALVPLGGKQFLFKLVTTPDGKKMAQRLEARLGLRLEGQVEVLEGLAAGDQVVTAGHGRLARSEKSPVRVIDLAAPAGGGKGPGAAKGPGGANGPGVAGGPAGPGGAAAPTGPSAASAGARGPARAASA
ncbi:MAG: efflux RND transporter periplasmic adaptor subunit [Rubrivivax sp.]